jgi:signal transduction histidine kinase
MIRFNMPKLRIYQQILIGFILTVALPLVLVTVLIHLVNQAAMKKEMERFTRHTAEALYKDFDTEMSWQKQQTRLMGRLVSKRLEVHQPLPVIAQDILALDDTLEAVGFYNREGELIDSRYRHFQEISPELRLPDAITLKPEGDITSLGNRLATKGINKPDKPFQVIYFTGEALQETPYYLRASIPVSLNRRQTSSPVFYYVQQKNFSYLKNMVQRNNALYKAFYIIDDDGFIIAGPPAANLQERISKEDLQHFIRIQPGVSHQFSSMPLSKDEPHQKKKDDIEEPERLKKVIVKMPEVHWGIIIESPYHMEQKYIKRAGTQTILLIVGYLVVILALILPYILGISRNFRQLIKGVKALGEGNYYRRIRLITNVFTPYEIVYLTVEFNRMARKTADSWQAIQEANHQLAKLDEFKSNLIDTISHELRTPLTSIKGYTSRLLRYENTLDSETRVKSLKVVKQQADRLGRLVEDLLVIPDLESAGLRVYLDEVLLMTWVENAVQFIQVKEERDIRVVLEEGLDAKTLKVLVDPDRLEQILLNLLDNAVKYSLPGTAILVDIVMGKRLVVDQSDAESLEEMAENCSNTSFVTLTVKNCCELLTPHQAEQLDSLFEKFKRLDDSLVRTTRGSGLGLFITRGLVVAMGGDIRLGYTQQMFEVRLTLPLYQETLAACPTLDKA